MKLKLFIKIFVITTAVSCFSISIANAATPPVNGSVILDGQPLSFDAKPIVINGNTMVPFRRLFETLKMNVNWDSKTKNITATKDDLTIEMALGSFKATVNEKEYTLTQTPFDSPEGTVYVILRFISEAVGATVSWDNEKKIATINTK
ncbi:hypothetical protein FHS19_006964 [Paenibacillus rhizosphaerae]|uniref:Copper amine oxidase-like N-terminal domain-containing protein n=1 Tax=Paenibacillus rhizosphaerae TaxID=297318 RepID=A0A839TZD4_9BACL|nr:copper amine oxidase N-terminal domain-containing protein [Paenibacillus rhizosphaerae]MBB3132235.1 hypothetical protein [Paenibacillus rhizosphaerae]